VRENMATILIVDDMQTDRMLIGGVAASAGHNVVYASTGKEALDAARRDKPALVLMDVLMPDMDGFKTCREMKKDPGLSAVPIVMITSKSTDSDRFWARKQGADDLLGKPFKSEDLTAVIRRYVR
jgi:twitching motility two-component system response regulator PilH